MTSPSSALAFTPEIERETRDLYQRVRHVIPDVEWPVHAPLISAINRLKRERKAIILVHNYMTPEIFHGVADYSGDSLGLAQFGERTDADTIVMCGVHFMAETAKILSPAKTVLLPDLRAGCSLAASITAADVRALRTAPPGRARRDLREHLRRREGRIRHLLHVGQRGSGGRVARRRRQ